jgi:tetratricopeptide (TPR) repeat protein
MRRSRSAACPVDGGPLYSRRVAKPLYPRTNRIILIAFWLSVAGGLAWQFSIPSLDEQEVLPSHGIADQIELKDGALRVSFRGSNSFFCVDTLDEDARRALVESGDTNRSIAWRVHLNGAYLENQSASMYFWVESFEYDGRRFGPYAARTRRSWRRMPPESAALIRGAAFLKAHRLNDAIRQLDAALSGDALGRRHTFLALDLRANALEGLAYPSGSTVNDADDALVMRAIQDWRRAAGLDADSFRQFMDEANATVMLGAYPEALAMFEEALRRWPGEYFYIATRKGAVHRLLGEHDSALAALDDLVAQHGPQGGMMYHYHRGWTLNELQRYEEAEQEFTAGLESQPDYPYAFAARACARAQLGKTEDAVEDQWRAVELQQQMAAALPGDGAASRAQARLALTLDALERSHGRNPGQATDIACAGLHDFDPRGSYRPRSRLFVPR